MTIKYLAIAFLAIVFSLPLSAQQCNSVEKKLMLFYANGMLNSFEEAQRSLDYSYLELLRQGKAQNLDIEYQVLENVSESNDDNAVSEGLEVVIQYLGYQADFQIKRFLNWYRYKSNDTDKDEESMFLEILDRFYKTASYDQDLIRHETQYANAFNNSYKVMVIAHSQGNLYTEKAYKSFLLDNYQHGEDYTILSVGTPVVLPEKLMMLRDKKDPIIYFSDDTLPPNITPDLIDNKTIPEFVIDGEFVPLTLMPYHSYFTYLYGSDSREMIQEYFKSSIDNLFPQNDTYAYRVVLDKLGNDNVYMGVFGGVNGEPFNAIPKEDPMYSSGLFDPASVKGKLTTGITHDEYTISCDEIPVGKQTAGMNPGIWNKNSEDVQVKITEYLLGENPISGTYWIEGSPNEGSYSIEQGVMISKDENGNISYWN